MPVTLSDLLDGFLWADARSGFEFRAYICRQTGKIYYHTDYDSGEIEEPLPDDIDDTEKYLPIPDKRGLDLGKPLVLAFVREQLPDDYDEVRDIFSRRRAYQKFKSLLSRRGAIDRWHAFENEATEQALRDWCALHGIEIAD
ncbi:MAG TPA: UPF0158 family protein [Bradyrhizobium sp.]|nr:UPF0158 family protein [Bradyrhizobium sp.]